MLHRRDSVSWTQNPTYTGLVFLVHLFWENMFLLISTGRTYQEYISPGRNYRCTSVHSISAMGNMPLLGEGSHRWPTWKISLIKKLTKMNAYMLPSQSSSGRKGNSRARGDC